MKRYLLEHFERIPYFTLIGFMQMAGGEGNDGQRAGVLTEATYPVSAVTTKNTRTIQNDLGTFVFRHIQPVFYTGFSQESFHGMIYHLASVSKALFDYLYLRPLPRPVRTRDFNLAEDLRIHLDDWPGAAREAVAA